MDEHIARYKKLQDRSSSSKIKVEFKNNIDTKNEEGK
jgi:hypothetical protein